MAIPHTDEQFFGDIGVTSLKFRSGGATAVQISVDVGLGGESAADDKLATQKAIKTYADSLPAVAPIIKSENAFAITPASATDGGYITTDAQTIAGEKTFAGGLITPTRSIGDNSTNVATTAFVGTANAAAIKQSAFDVSNGWISGGAITAALGGTTFSIAQCVCRFTDYSDPANPVVGPPTTYGPWLDVPSQYPDALIVGIYLDRTNPGTLFQNRDVSLNPSLLYGNYVQLGIIVQDRGIIQRVTNNKLPWGSRGNIAAIEFCDRLAPLNLGPLSVQAHASIPLAIRVSVGQLWSIGINLPGNYLNPNVVTIPPIGQGDPMLDPPPVMYRVWRDNLGVFHPVGPIDPSEYPLFMTIDTANYNPGGNSETLVAIPALNWVAVPIIFNKSIDLYLWQYPTTSYSTMDMAMANAGKFVRFPELSVVNIIGYVVFQVGATDWSAATFMGGEFFNYGVGGSSGGSGGGSVSNTIYRRTNTAWIDQSYGSDSSGTVTYASLPFRTWEGAMSAIAGQTIDNAYFVNFSAGTHVLATFALEPFISFGGSSGLSTVISVFDGAHGNVTINAAAFAGVANAEIIGSDMRFGAGTGWDLDFAAMGPSFGNLSTINISRINIAGTMAYKGRAVGVGGDPFASGDTFRSQSSFFDGAVSLDGGAFYAGSTVFSATAPITVAATSANSTLVITGSQVAAINASGTHAIIIVLSSCTVLGNIVVDGANVVLRVSRDSIPPAPFTVQVLNGATYIVYDDQLTTDQAAGIAAAALPISAGNPAVDTQTLNTALSAKVDKTTTINGHALSANVVVSASDLTTGTLPHAQLPALQSGDIPNNAANTSGTAAALSAVSTLPNGTTAASQARGDNSGKIATTEYVDRLIGAASGVASLDGTGKVPVAQLPDTVVGAMEYKGVLNASGGVYPALAEKGDYYVVNVAGTISGTYYNINDWVVYNGVGWDQIENTDVASVLSAWTGNGVLSSVGTITVGSWNATVIPSSKGGAGAISGIMKANGSGVVSAAAADTDYVAPSTTSVISGEKTITALKTTTRAVGDNSTWGATTAFVQAFANKAQANIIYLSATGADTLDGTTINNAVLTFPRAITLASGATSAAPITIHCEDARIYDGAALVMAQYVSVDAPSLTMNAACSIGDYSSVEFAALAAPATVAFTGGTGAGPACLRAKRAYGVPITVADSQGTRYVAVDSLEMVNNTTTVITCGSKLCVAAQRVVGRITTTSVSAIVDLTNVAFIDITTTGTGTVLYPPMGAGSASGILKCNGTGVVSAASAGSDYLVGNQTITLSGDIGGSGATAIATTIANGAVSLAKMSNLAAHSVIANTTNTPAAPGALTIDSQNVASTAVMRNVYGCASATHWQNAIETSDTVANIALSAASAATQRVTGTIISTVTLPNAGTLTLGREYTIINDASNIVRINNSAGTLLGTIGAGLRAQLYYAAVNGTIGTWTINTMVQQPSNETINIASATISVSTTLTAASLDVQHTTGTVAFTLTLPDARTLSLWRRFKIYQACTGVNVTLKNNTGTTLYTILPGTTVYALCYSILTQGGSWEVDLFESVASLTPTSANTQYITGTGTFDLALPDARTMFVGREFTIYQTSTGVIALKRSGGTVIFAMTNGVVATVTCNDNSTQAGVWLVRTSCMYNPQRLISYPNPSAASTTLQITAEQLYGGPWRISSSTSGTFLLPTATDLVTTLTTKLGFVPPIGWYFDAWVIGSVGVYTAGKLAAGTGGTLYRPTYGGTDYDGFGWKLTIWITSNVPTYTYSALVLEFY